MPVNIAMILPELMHSLSFFSSFSVFDQNPEEQIRMEERM